MPGTEEHTAAHRPQHYNRFFPQQRLPAPNKGPDLLKPEDQIRPTAHEQKPELREEPSSIGRTKLADADAIRLGLLRNTVHLFKGGNPSHHLIQAIAVKRHHTLTYRSISQLS